MIKKLWEKIKEKIKPKRNRQKGKILPPKPELRPEAPQNYIHLSFLKHYLKKYNLDSRDENSFFSLRAHLIDDGKKVVSDKLKEVISKSNTVDSIATELLKRYKELREKEIKLSLRPGDEDRNTPKIYKGSVNKYLKEFGLEKEAEKNFPDTILKVLDKIYDKGKQQMINRLEPNMKWLEKFLSERKLEEADKEIKRIKKILDES